MSDALFVQGVMPSGVLPDNLASFPVRTATRGARSTSNPAMRAIDLAGVLGVGLLGAIIVAASLLAICFCFVPG